MKSVKSHFCMALLGLSIPFMADAEVRMPSVFSDGMVLQRNSQPKIWGRTTRPKANVTVAGSWGGAPVQTKADADGNWSVNLSTGEHGGPYELTVSDADGKVTIGNVMLGEVWVCSGQSNMDMRMSGRYNEPVIGSLDKIVTSGNSDIRMFTVGAEMLSEPASDCKGSWEEASSVTVPEFSATAYYFARKMNEVLNVPVGIIHASYGGSRVEAWMSNEGAAPYVHLPEVRNSGILYNGMLAPVVGYGMRGVIWYQGEANVDAPDLYTELLPAMVADWRGRWGEGEFPFYYAQIAPYNYNKGAGKGENSAYLREAQVKCLDLIPESGMVILTDVGDARTIHPMDKETVGNRFAYLALAGTYGYGGYTPTGPVYESMQVDGNEAIISFDNIGKGLTSYRKPLTGFEIAGADRVFHPANARFGKDAQTVIVSSSEVAEPVAVRYGFTDCPDGSLFNMFGLPASTFRTDNW